MKTLDSSPGRSSTPRQYDVITLGDMCVDLIVSGEDVVPRFGQVEKLVDEYTLEMGGSCCLFACQAARLGLRVGILGRVGDDSFGQLILRRLQECRVDTQHVIVDPTLKTGLGVALCQTCDGAGDRAILTYLGSLCALQPEDITDSFLASARHLHHGSFFLQTGLRPHIPRILSRARTLGLSTSLDPNWDPQEQWNSTLLDALPWTDLFLPNDQEALHISRRETPQEAAAWLRERGAPIVAIKQGAKGASVYHERGTNHCAVTAVTGGDSIGAGDSFDAGFIAAWLRGLPVKQCLDIACRCGRAVASAIGGLTGQPGWDQVKT